MSQLKRDLGLFSCVMLVIGNIIGVGIFTTPGEIAQGLPTAGWVLVAWLVGGLLTTAGALTYAELGTMFPKAGGNYVFLREAYGPLWGFLYGWAYTLVTSTGTIALLAIGFSEYVGFHSGTWGSKILSLSGVLVLTLLNAGGVMWGARVTNAITSLKIVAMFLLVVIGFSWGHGQMAHFVPLFGPQVGGPLMAIGAALVPMAFTYSGWNSSVLVAEEIKNPDRMLPLSLVLGTMGTALIYILMNAVYLYAVPVQQLVGEIKIAHVAAQYLFGPQTTFLIQALVATSVLGCLSASLLANPRTTFAMGRDGLFFRFTGTVHPKYQTPTGAILFQGLWACVLILIGNFEQILTFLSVPLVIIFAMTVFSIFVFRRKNPDLPRPYRCWGYPWVPALYVLVSIFMIVAKIQQRGMAGMIGIFIFLSGVPVFYAWRRTHQKVG